MKKKKSILIIGANGFIGKNLCVKLSEFSEFSCLRFLRTDDITSLREKIRISDVIIHLASEIRQKTQQILKIMLS